MVKVSHNFGLSAEYVFARFHVVRLLRNALRGEGTVILSYPTWIPGWVTPCRQPRTLWTGITRP